jgi:Activator of Hsp90 ATPase homolog 1-like protein
MTIETLDPSERIVWGCQGDNPDWNGTTLTWAITPHDQGSMLHFTRGGWKAANEFFAICNSTWGELMYRIRGYLEGRKPGPHWTR